MTTIPGWRPEQEEQLKMLQDLVDRNMVTVNKLKAEKAKHLHEYRVGLMSTIRGDIESERNRGLDYISVFDRIDKNWDAFSKQMNAYKKVSG